MKYGFDRIWQFSTSTENRNIKGRLPFLGDIALLRDTRKSAINEQEQKIQRQSEMWFAYLEFPVEFPQSGIQLTILGHNHGSDGSAQIEGGSFGGKKE